jgi:hypothetical protein
VDPGLARPAAGILGMSEKSRKIVWKIEDPRTGVSFSGGSCQIAAIGVKKLTWYLFRVEQ